MDTKHSDPKLSVEEAWLTMTICLYMGAGSITPHQLIIYISVESQNHLQKTSTI